MAGREKPKFDNFTLSDSTFAAFEEMADQQGYGDYQEDWEPWWDCWFAGYCQGAEEWKDGA